MCALTGRIKDLSVDFKTGQPLLTLLINEKQTAMSLYDELHEVEKLSISIGKYREKRSLSANGYMWTLCGELAKKLSNDKVTHTKEDIYRDAIKEVGVWYDDEIEPDKVQRRCKAWQLIGTGWLTERVDFTADGEKEVIRFYYGSSQYNKKQMAKLIDNIVQDCQAVGIETKTPEELAKLKALWGEQ